MSEPATSPLVRAALFVSDLDRSTRFYRALGLTAVFYEGALDPGSVNALLALPPTTATRCRILKTPGAPNFGMVGLFELSNPSPAALDRGDGRIRAGEATLVFFVGERFDGAIAELIEAGGRMVTAPMLFDGPFERQREALLRDPDGVLLNVIERPPARAFSDRPAIQGVDQPVEP